MSAIATRINAVLRDANIPVEQHADVAGMIAAQQFAMSFPLPSTEVETPHRYYTDNLEAQARRAVFALNDHRMVNIDSTIALVRKLWVARYRMCYDPKGIGLLCLVDYCDTGVSAALTPQQREMIKGTDLGRLARHL